MKPVILITGASGFTGEHACRHFQALGMRVFAVSRSPYATLSADIVRSCDVTDPRSVQQVVTAASPDYVLHLAGMNDVRSSWKDPLACMEVNVTGTLHLLSSLTSLDRKPRVLIVSSALSFDPADEPPRPSHPYALSKTLQTLTARAWSHMFDIPVMAAEPSNLIGPGTSTGLCGLLADYIVRWERGSADDPFQVSSLTERRNYLDVRDAVTAYERILLQGTPGTLYRFGSQELRSIGEVLSSFESALGKPFPYTNLHASPRDPDPSLPSPVQMAHIGWTPRIPFARSIRDILQDARARQATPSD